MCVALERQIPHNMHLEKYEINRFKIISSAFCMWMEVKKGYVKCKIWNSPENILAIAAIKKLRTTPGPAIDLATIPATRYIPVPQHEPTPSDVKSNVVKHFC